MSRRSKISHLEAHLGYWLRFVSNHASHAFSVKLAARGVTVAEWVLLRELYDRESAAPSELAERLGMTRGAISKLVERLSVKSLVTRSGDARDGRRHHLTLSPAGRSLAPELAALADRNDEEFFGQLSQIERETIETAMKKVVSRHKLRAAPVD
jgi:DNA-binding MarR family transcriptional regulator